MSVERQAAGLFMMREGLAMDDDVDMRNAIFALTARIDALESSVASNAEVIARALTTIGNTLDEHRDVINANQRAVSAVNEAVRVSLSAISSLEEAIEMIADV